MTQSLEKKLILGLTLHPEMQQLELEKLNLTKLWKTGFLCINPFSYPSWDTFPEEEVYDFSVYGNRQPIIRSVSISDPIRKPTQSNLV